MANTLSRRTVLQGLGTAIALPLFEAMLPGGFSASRSLLASEAGAAESATPRRLGFFYVPNGVHMADWTPAGESPDYAMPWILEPLAGVRDRLTVFTGLTQQKAFANGDGPGDHARALATFLTGCQAKKTHGADIRAGVSVDQLAANHLARHTRFASLELGCDEGAQSGNCDSGYSCAYSSNIAWKSATQPLPKENNPKLVFERLFASGRPGESAEARARRERREQSVLDFVGDDAKRLHGALGAGDRRKLEEYLTAVRELERRIVKNEKDLASGKASFDPKSAWSHPEGVPDNYEQHLKLMADLMVLAFQTDSTRISTFVLANEGSNRTYRFLDVPEGHHELSHHGKDAAKLEKIKKINRFHISQYAYLLEKLKSIPEGEGTLLDNCAILYGSGIGDGDAHNHDDLPIVVGGRLGGTIASNRHLRYERGTPLTNLYLSLLDRVGVPCEEIGDSTGRLGRLEG
jgi:hypothetical protein